MTHDPFARLPDAVLLEAQRAMRIKAWEAPKSLEGTYNDAHARWADEWCQLSTEVQRRGLVPLAVAKTAAQGDV